MLSRRAFLAGALASGVAPAASREATDAFHEGLVRDGVTDDFPKFRALIQSGSGKSIYLPGGANSYCFDVTRQSGAVFPDGTELWGDAQTVIELRTTAPGPCCFANLFGDHINVHDLRVVGNFAQGTTGWAFSFAGERGVLKNVAIDLRNREVAPDKSLHAVAGLYPSANRPSTGWEFTGLDIDRTQRAWFRANADRAEHNDLAIRSCLFRRSFKELFIFNSPSSAIRRAEVTQCRFEGNPLNSRPVLLLGLTGARDSVVRHCTFSGQCKDAIHIEEDTEKLLIEDCQFDILGNGIAILRNNVGGKYVSPRDISIRDNVFRGRDSAPGVPRGRAIRCVWDGTGVVAASSVSVVDNQIDGFEMGIDFGDVPAAGIQAHGNRIANCPTAIRSLTPSLGVSNNILRNCRHGLLSRAPGNWGKQAEMGCLDAISVQ